jgi:transcriptional regulator with XRE-family HTH domain
MSLRQVEKITKISNSYLSQMERDKRNVPTLSILGRLADAYGVKATDLMDAADKDAIPIKIDDINLIASTSYIFREYNKLSDNRKKTLKDFLQYLVEQEFKTAKEIKEE